MSRCVPLAVCLTLLIGMDPARAAGDFPASSCKGWNGTVVVRDGIDTSRAFMSGIVTKADVQEYCERDPGGETKAYGGRLTTGQCVEKYLAQERRTRLVSRADCRTGRISYVYGSREEVAARFPLGPDADTSCASGMPPLIGQFRMLCPKAAARMGVKD